MQPTPANWPTLKVSTSAPTAVTTPTISCLSTATHRDGCKLVVRSISVAKLQS